MSLCRGNGANNAFSCALLAASLDCSYTADYCTQQLGINRIPGRRGLQDYGKTDRNMAGKVCTDMDACAPFLIREEQVCFIHQNFTRAQRRERGRRRAQYADIIGCSSISLSTPPSALVIARAQVKVKSGSIIMLSLCIHFTR
jgi:hypothetical protein